MNHVTHLIKSWLLVLSTLTSAIAVSQVLNSPNASFYNENLVGFNFEIAGIDQDGTSFLQIQSNSANLKELRPPDILLIELPDNFRTNKPRMADTATSFQLNKPYMLWGNNGASLDSTQDTITVNLSAGITPSLNTDVSLTSMQRVWKVLEHSTGADIPKVKISIPQNALGNSSGGGSYYMFISNTGIFDVTSDYQLLTLEGDGLLTTEYNFDHTNYITFGYAPDVTVERSIYFDGVEDYVDMDNNLDLNPTGFTISAWIKRDLASTNATILSKRDPMFSRGYDFKLNDAGKLQMTWKHGSEQNLVSSTTIPVNEWHHVAAVYNGTTLSLYIDGVVDTFANLVPPVDTDESFHIAAAGTLTPSQFFKGNIDEVRIWNTELSIDQLRFIMNQEIENNASFVKGTALPYQLSKNEVASLLWNKLAGYYPMSVYTFTNTADASGNGNHGRLRNLNTVDVQTAPLPYESAQAGSWDSTTTWNNGLLQYIPGSTSIVNPHTTIDWNIVRTIHDVDVNNLNLPIGNASNRTILALMVNDNKLSVNGNNLLNTGHGITVTHYLDLDGTIDLEGESQLIQTLDSDFEVTSGGKVERDQQGTADKFTYNYWSSPVGTINTISNNNNYRVKDVMKDGLQNINWITSGYNGTDTNPIGIADYWVWKYANLHNNTYSLWQHIRSSGVIKAGEGFTMKGPGSGQAADEQNYVFKGKPNNGNINLTISPNNEYLVGNPYPSAIDGRRFILDNGNTLTENSSISGTLYFWEHWAAGSHVINPYKGGYATYNLSGGTPAASFGTNNPNVATGGTPTRIPGRYIPVSQGFFVAAAGLGGEIKFNNGQRVFVKESPSNSVSGTSDVTTTTDYTPDGADARMKFRIGFNSVNTIHRQLLLTVDELATDGVDWGYDAQHIDDQMDDMYWMLNGEKYTIQGIEQILPTSIVPLGLHLRNSGQNSISIDYLENIPDDLDIFLHDKQLDYYHDLRQSTYSFALPAGIYLDRYEITFQMVSALGVEEHSSAPMNVYYANENQNLIFENPDLNETRNIEMFNILGQSVYYNSKIENSTYTEFKIKNLSSGTYIVKLMTRSGSISKKVLVK